MFCDPTLTFTWNGSPKLYTHTTLVETGSFLKIDSRGLIMLIFLNILKIGRAFSHPQTPKF